MRPITCAVLDVKLKKTKNLSFAAKQPNVKGHICHEGRAGWPSYEVTVQAVSLSQCERPMV